MTVMYSALLAASLEVAPLGPDDPSEEDTIVRELTVCRHRMGGRKPAAAEVVAGPETVSRIAVQLSYDLALLRLCRLRGIPCEAARFTRPLSERHRLEELLADAGVELRR